MLTCTTRTQCNSSQLVSTPKTLMRVARLSRVLTLRAPCSYVVLFSLSVVVSMFSLFVNVRIFASSLRKRFSSKVGVGNRIQVQIHGKGSALARQKSVDELKDELEDNQFSRWQHYCNGLLIAFEVCLNTRTA